METQQPTKQIGIRFGILSDTIAEQLTKQEFLFDKKTVERFEKQKYALDELRMGDLLTDSICDKITQKLFNKIRAHVMKKNKLKIVK